MGVGDVGQEAASILVAFVGVPIICFLAGLSFGNAAGHAEGFEKGWRQRGALEDFGAHVVVDNPPRHPDPDETSIQDLTDVDD